jgi:ABC-2 type transport system permease protein
MSLVVFPVFLLSGALFPLTQLPPSLTLLTSLDPLAYGVDGLRWTLSGQAHFSPALTVTVLVVTAGVLCAIGAWRFSKIQS